ncbi:hypothetical protein K7X08_029780 [Anisodus acutangulus]|uniref:Uncharacterized protein n=1 Tax=Anisodus acutangulus TaxID=402998 RepID=A0A9Q1MFB6_9SOLA|nr:hypothetical protein K7X08_029780 [Anisodus acutangulus]
MRAGGNPLFSKTHLNPNPILNEKQLPLVIINTSVQEVPSQTYDASSEHQETHSSTPGDRTIDQSTTTLSLQSKKHDQSARKKSGEGVTSENDLQLGLGDATQLQSHINQHGMHGGAANSSVQPDGIVFKLHAADTVKTVDPTSHANPRVSDAPNNSTKLQLSHVVPEVSGTAANTTKHSKMALPTQDASTGRGGDMQVIAAHSETLQGIETEIQHVGEDEQEFEVQLDALPTVAVKQKQQESHKQLDDYEDRDEESIAQDPP